MSIARLIGSTVWDTLRHHPARIKRQDRGDGKITRSATIPPAVEDLERYAYRGKYKGMLLLGQRLVYGYPKVPLYEERSYMDQYERHNTQVVDYFANRTNSLLTLNLEDRDAFQRLCRFIGLNPERAAPIPHLNRTDTRGRADVPEPSRS